MSAPETLRDALADGWSDEAVYGSEIAVEQVDPFVIARYRDVNRDLGPDERAARDLCRPHGSGVLSVGPMTSRDRAVVAAGPVTRR